MADACRVTIATYNVHSCLGTDGRYDVDLVARVIRALDTDVVVHYSPPVVVLRVKVMDLPADDGKLSSLARRLLELNATELVHGSYGFERDAVVLTEALELSHLDYEEFLASYEGLTLALAAHLRELVAYREAQ